jgi:hypothetical protein
VIGCFQGLRLVVFGVGGHHHQQDPHADSLQRGSPLQQQCVEQRLCNGNMRPTLCTLCAVMGSLVCKVSAAACC